METSRNVFDVIKNVIRRLNRTSAYLNALSNAHIKRALVAFSSTIKNVCLEWREVIPIGLRRKYQAISHIAD